MKNKKNVVLVVALITIAIPAIIFLYLNFIGIQLPIRIPHITSSTYQVSGTFDNIGSLKLNAPVKIGGVVIGRVIGITLDPKTYSPKVTIGIARTYNQIPDTSSLAISTSGLLGEQYISLNIGFVDPEIGTSVLKEGSVIHDTKSAVTVEDFIGQFIYKIGSNNTTRNSQYDDINDTDINNGQLEEITPMSNINILTVSTHIKAPYNY